MLTEDEDDVEKDGRMQTKEDAEKEGEEDPDSPIPIDRGWAWMVVLGCFGMHVLVVGGVKSFGVLFVELQQRYDVSAKQLGIMHGLASVLMMALGPVSNALSVRYSCRAVVFAGGLLIGSGFVASACVTSFPWLYFTYSVLTGLGSALAYAPSVVMVGHHFARRRALANGISVSGSAVGSFLLPNLMRLLLNQYGLRGALAVLGAVMLNVCLCAVLFRPFSSYRNKPSARSDEEKSMDSLPLDFEADDALSSVRSVTKESLAGGVLGTGRGVLDSSLSKEEADAEDETDEEGERIEVEDVGDDDDEEGVFCERRLSDSGSVGDKDVTEHLAEDEGAGLICDGTHEKNGDASSKTELNLVRASTTETDPFTDNESVSVSDVSSIRDNAEENLIHESPPRECQRSGRRPTLRSLLFGRFEHSKKHPNMESVDSTKTKNTPEEKKSNHHSFDDKVALRRVVGNTNCTPAQKEAGDKVQRLTNSLDSMDDSKQSLVLELLEDNRGSSERCPRSPLFLQCQGRRAILLPSVASSSSTDTDLEGSVTTMSIRDSFEKKLARNASSSSMTTHFGSIKQKSRQPKNSKNREGGGGGGFKPVLGQNSLKSNSPGTAKRRAFKGGRPTLERHPSALWDARLPESLKQAIEEERQREQRAESIEMSALVGKNGQSKQEASKDTRSTPAAFSRTDSGKDAGKRVGINNIGSFKAIDVANPVRMIQERKKLLLASNVRYMSETRDVGVASPTLKANEKAPLKRFFSVEAGQQASPPLYESYLHRRIRQISEADSWKTDSSIFASAGDLALASLQNISASANETEDDVTSNTSRGVALKGILRLSTQTLPGQEKKRSVPLFDLSLMVNPVFLVFFLSLTCMNFGYPNIFVMLPSFCQEVGLDKTTAAFMVSIIGVTDLVGRLFIGWFADLRLFPRKYGFMASVAVAGLLCVLLPRMKSFNGLIAFCCGFGFCGGCFIALIAVILVDFLGKEKLASSFGLASVAMAVGLMAGPAIYGNIRDTSGSWDSAFFVSGSMSIAAALCIFIQPLAQRLLHRPMKTRESAQCDEML